MGKKYAECPIKCITICSCCCQQFSFFFFFFKSILHYFIFQERCAQRAQWQTYWTKALALSFCLTVGTEFYVGTGEMFNDDFYYKSKSCFSLIGNLLVLLEYTSPYSLLSLCPRNTETLSKAFHTKAICG